MNRHRIDPLSAALGLIGGAAGIAVAADEADSFGQNGVWWLAAAALLLGIGLVPWNRRARRADK